MAQLEKTDTEAKKAPARSAFFDNRPRRFPFRKRIQIPIIAAAVSTALRAMEPTLRVEPVGVDHVIPFFVSPQRCIFCFWHRGTIPMLCFGHAARRASFAGVDPGQEARQRPMAVLSSANFDGQWSARVGASMGFTPAVGSSSRGGLSGFAELEKHLLAGTNVAMAVDGPRGPRYVAKPGPVYLAQRTGCPIICVHGYCENAIELKKSWDRLQIPLPFSRMAVVFNPPLWVPNDASPEFIQRKFAEMQRRMELARDAAESWFDRSPAEQERDRVLANGPSGLGAAG